MVVFEGYEISYKMINKNTSKLLSLWSPPQDAGDPVGCLSTTFTFDAEFFEEECLGRFVKMESDPFSDGPVYLIEREEKLAGIKAAALVDKNHCRGKRSLRWDLISFRKNNLLHSKITFLYWGNYIRVIIGSANLTKSGYRLNQEVFGVLDFYKDSDIPSFIFEELINYLRLLVSESGNSSEQPEVLKWNDLLDMAWEKRDFFCSVSEYRGYKNMRVYPVFVRPGDDSLYDQIRGIWKHCSDKPPRKAYITSPFFDDSSPNKPAEFIWEVLALRGEAKVTYNVIAQTGEKDDEIVTVRAPRSLSYSPRGRSQASVRFDQIKEEESIDSKLFNRPLHQKSIWLEGDDWSLYLIGSSNFTSAGTGLHSRCNYEANVAYIVSSKKNPRIYKQLIKSWPYTYPLKKIDTWSSLSNEDEESNKEDTILPKAFLSAYYDLVDGKQALKLEFKPSELPKDFEIFDERNKLLLNEQNWNNMGRNKEVILFWNEIYLPSGLIVRWRGIEGSAWWPLNVINQSVLPVPEELKELSLETLLSILSSPKPLYRAMKKWLRTKDKNREGSNEELDALKRVNTNDFLLQRTRRISYALNTMKEKLEKPLYTIESLHWRLYGPVGVNALCNAILKEAHSNEEKLFLLAEIALELSELKLIKVENSLDPEEIRIEILKLINEIQCQVKSLSKKLKIKSLQNYLLETFQKALNEV